MPLIRNNPNTAHSVLAIVAGVLSQLCVLIISPYWLLLWFSLIYFLFAPLPKWLNGKGIFVLEVYCYTTLIAAILCH